MHLNINYFKLRICLLFVGFLITVFFLLFKQHHVLALYSSDHPETGNTKICQDKKSERTIYYDVAAFEVSDLPLNGWGDRFTKANIYALNNPQAFPNKDSILGNKNLASPLVLRANAGDCVVVRFKNEVPDKRVGMTIAGLSYDPKTSDGSRVGLNNDTTAATGEERVYVWYAENEGQFPINDMANTNPASEKNTMKIGLYGGFIVEPKGSVWRNPVTGAEILKDIAGKLIGVETPVFADIEVPGGDKENPNDFRDYALVFLDENEEIIDASGSHPTFPTTNLEDSTFGFNYRSEPLRNRLRAILDHRAGKIVTLPNGRVILPTDNFCDGFDTDLKEIAPDQSAKCFSEEVHLQSWPFGDHGKLVSKTEGGKIVVDSDNLIPKAYVGDPLRFRIIHPGEKEHHTFHQHQHRWFHEPDDPNSTRLDVQLTGPGQTFQLRYEKGAGAAPGSPGDAIFHCHLYPHFAQGFWGTLRTFDKLRNTEYNQVYPDGTPIETLQELPDRKGLTVAPTEVQPGFPLFIKGQFLQKAYRPPNFVVEDPYQTDANNKPLRRPGDTVRKPTELEKTNMAGNNGRPGSDTTPGVFYQDPCPTGAKERTYHPVAIDADPDHPTFKALVMNESGNGTGGWQDPDGKLYVEKSHLQDVLSGKEKPEPYVIRNQVGECANIRFTNLTHEDDLNNPENVGQPVPVDIHGDGEKDLFEDQIFHHQGPMSELSVHTHLFMYDLLSSDGTSVGWNYDQSALAGQTIGSRLFVDMNLRTVFFHDHQFPNTGQQHGLYAAWNVEPDGSTWEKPDGSSSDGVGTTANIIVPKGTSFREFSIFYADFVPGFRPAPDLPGNQGPAEKDIVPISPRGMDGAGDYGADQGTMTVNYRNEPFQIRINPHLPSSIANKNDPAYIFSSAVFGDPATPIFKAYRGDPIVVRLVQGAHEEQHNFNIHGHRWLHEPDDPQSNLYDAQSMNIAEFFNFELQGTKLVKRLSGAERAREIGEMIHGATQILLGGAGSSGDYLYGSLPMDDLWNGMWGIMRVFASQTPDLKPLPQNKPPVATSQWPALKPGEPLKKAKSPGNPCLPGAPQRNYKLGAISKKIVYNGEGDHDPNGLMYTLLDKANKPIPSDKPLFIRANEGDCINITLKNLLPTEGIKPHVGDTHPPEDIFPKLADGTVCNQAFGADSCGVEEEEKKEDSNPRWNTSKRVSLHPHLLKYDVVGSDGATVGYNFDQTIAPGETISYKWYVDTKNLGIINLADFGDIRGHRHHGLFGGLIVEHKFATYLDPQKGTPTESGESAVIKYFDQAERKYKAFREFVIAFQDGLNLFSKNNLPIPDLKEGHEDIEDSNTPRKTDPEDQGHKGINYRAERFANRLAHEGEEAWIFSSNPEVGHNDPATPVFQAYKGDPVVLRVFNPQDKPRGHAFNLHGHSWMHEQNDPQSTILNTQGGINTGRAFNLTLLGGGGAGSVAGDFLFKCNVFFNHLNDGLWGILRVFDTPQQHLLSLEKIIGAVRPSVPTPRSLR
ncbi:MAG: hypothetical protein HYW45_03935 [Candidatus Daviesbacteria bacterium]|nr:MAG: hypothetical protein HYW45_03935 [Candidatus Daviesbacteria bacterium]